MRIVVYPNNTVTIDGRDEPYTLRELGIPKKRALISAFEGGKAWAKYEDGGVEWLVFPTEEMVAGRPKGLLTRWHRYKDEVLYLRCSRCNYDKKETEFHISSSNTFGRHSQCKLCRSNQ